MSPTPEQGALQSFSKRPEYFAVLHAIKVLQARLVSGSIKGSGYYHSNRSSPEDLGLVPISMPELRFLGGSQRQRLNEPTKIKDK
jgi:hypothetical protein